MTSGVAARRVPEMQHVSAIYKAGQTDKGLDL